MKKRLLAVILSCLVAMTAFLSSCSTTDEDQTIAQEETQRRAQTIVLTLMTGEETTDEAILAVQNAINNITMQRFKTQIILRYYKESEYEQKLDALVESIAVAESEKATLNAQADEAARESKRLAAIDKLINNDKNQNAAKDKWVPRDVEETETEEYFDTELNILGSAVQKYPAVTDTQLDIFLICGTENLTKYVKDEKYATDGESFLVALDDELGSTGKELYQYINPSVLLGGKVDNSIYAIPTNRQLAYEYTYMLIDRELAEKYSVNETKITTLADNEVENFLRQVKANESDVIPMRAATDAPGIVNLFPDEDTLFGTYVSNTSVAGFMSTPKNLLSAWQYTDHLIHMEQYERNGYFAQDPDAEGNRYAVNILTGDETSMAEVDTDKYIVKILQKPIATSETTGEYMLGVSKYAADSKRCMEIITYLNTNAEFRNLLQYGIMGENYKIDVDTGKLVRINHDYMMNIYTTGNTFIAYPEEDMELDVWEKAKETNRSTIVSPYLGFLFENEENAAMITEVKKLSEEALKKISEYDVEADRAAQLEAANTALDEARVKLEALSTELISLAAAYEPFRAVIEPIQAEYDEIRARLDAASEANLPFTQAVDAAQKALDDANRKITANDASVVRNQTQIEELNKEETPDAGKIKTLEDEITALNAETEALKGQLAELEAAVTAANEAMAPTQAVVDEIRAELSPVNDRLSEAVENGKEAKTALDAKTSEIQTEEKTISDLEKTIVSLTYTTEEEYDKVAETLYKAYFRSLLEELRTNEKYNDFMNSENENSVLYIYNEWYSEMYGS